MENNNRTFAVIGLGTFGFQTAEVLYEEGAQIIALDLDEEIIEHVRDHVTKAYSGDATDPDVLKATGILEADVVVVAIRNRFDTTVLVTHMLKEGNAREIHVLVNSLGEASAIRALGATSSIFPEYDLAQRVARQILYPNLGAYLALGETTAIMEVDLPKDFTGKNLIDLDVRKNHQVSIVAVKRKVKRRGSEQIVVEEPRVDQPFEEGDILIVLGNVERLSRFRKAMEEE